MGISIKKRYVILLFLALFVALTLQSASAMWTYSTPYENFDVNSSSGQITYRPLNMTWLESGLINKIRVGNTYWVPSYTSGSTGGNRTFSFWFKNHTSNIANFGNGINVYVGADINNLWGMGLENVTNNFTIYTYNGTNYPYGSQYVSNFSVTDNAWHYAVVGFTEVGSPNNANVSFFYYIDNVYYGTTPTSVQTSFGTYPYVQGPIDELRIYNKSLSSSEVSSLYALGRYKNKTILEDSLINHFSFNDYNQTKINDRVGNIGSNPRPAYPGVPFVWGTDGINITTTGYNENFNVSGMTNALIFWQNKTLINANASGTMLFSLLNNDTFYILDNYSVAPTIINPKAQAYPTNLSLPLDFTIPSFLINDTCIYWIINSTGGYEKTNTSISGCANTIFNISHDDTYTLHVWANDTYGNSGESSVTFSVITTAPAVVLNYPTTGLWLNYKINIPFNFTATYSGGVSACELWGNWTGAWHKNYTWTAPTNATMNSTLLNISDTYATWSVKCNQSIGNSAWALNNFTFGVDTIYPVLNVTNIQTSPGSQTIIFNSTETDTNLLSCKYSIFDFNNTIDGLNENVSFTCNAQKTAVVSAYATYNLTIYSVDIAGNENSTTKAFTTSQLSGGGGGGGGATPTPEEVIPVIGLANINNQSSYNNLEREIAYAKINSYCSNLKTDQPLAIQDFSGDCSLTLTDIAKISSQIAQLGVKITTDDLVILFKEYSAKQLFQGAETRANIDKYGLFTSVLGIPNPMTIYPPSVRTIVPILRTSGNITVDKFFTVNKNIRECVVLEGGENLTCTLITNTTFKISYFIGDLKFFDKIFTGTVSITSKETSSNLEVRSIPIELHVYNFAGSVLGIPAYMLIIAIILIIGVIILVVAKRKKFSKMLRRKS